MRGKTASAPATPMTQPQHQTSPTQIRNLLLRYRRSGDRMARDEVVDRLLPLARRVARTYPYREHSEDLVQVACVGLLKAIERWDPTRDHGSFTAYAVPTMLGEVRRFVRDHTWTVRPPRGLQERVLATSRATERLTTKMGRSPTPGQLAEELDLSLEEILEALQAGQAHGSVSLDAPAGGREEGGERRRVGDTLGGDDDRLGLAEELASLPHLMSGLTVQERRVVLLRFGEDLVQSDIAQRIGVSQMQVSRLLRGAMEKLRDRAEASLEVAEVG